MDSPSAIHIILGLLLLAGLLLGLGASRLGIPRVAAYVLAGVLFSPSLLGGVLGLRVGAQGELLGHISHKRLAEYVLAEHRPAHTRRQLMERVAGGVAADFMNTAFATAAPDEQLEDVLHRQLEHEIEDMPVVDAGGALLGAVNLTTVLRELMRIRHDERAAGDAD